MAARFFTAAKSVQALLGHCSSGAAFLVALSIEIDGRKSRDTDASLCGASLGPANAIYCEKCCCENP